MTEQGKEIEMNKTLVVKQDEQQPIAVEVMAEAILEISEAMKRISLSRLNRKALIVLITYSSKLPQRHVELVLNNLEQLEDTWLKPRTGKRG